MGRPLDVERACPLGDIESVIAVGNKYDIRFCQPEEKNLIMKFIDEDWRKNHVLAQWGELLDWQYLDAQENRYNFVAAIDRESGSLDGLLGFIPTYHFDQALRDQIHLWTAIEKVNRERSKRPFLGLEMRQFLYDQVKTVSLAGVGINENMRKLYDAMGFRTGALNHYYIANPDISEYRLLIRGETSKEPTPEMSICSLRALQSADDIPESCFCGYPEKSREYVTNRYLSHPFYKYYLFGIYRASEFVSAFMVRVAEAAGSRCLRIVDFFGAPAQAYNMKIAFVDLLQNFRAEYIDIYFSGLDEDVIANLGFKPTGNSVVPNYFEPFVRRNIDIMYAVKTDLKGYKIFKGDSDQDRPNLLPDSEAER